MTIELNDWDVAASNNNSAAPDGWPENTMQYSEVNNTGRENMAVQARADKDRNGSLTVGGVADAYTLTLNAAYSAYFQGMYFAAQFATGNTGATTINVNGIGAVAITDRAGNDLAPAEIADGGIYELRFDGTAFQLMGTLGAEVNTGTVVLSNPNEPDLIDTDVALNVGAADPDSAPHVEVGPSTVQSKASDTLPAKLNLNSNGGDVTIGSRTAQASEVTVYDQDVRKAAFLAVGPVFQGATNGDGLTDTVSSYLRLSSQDGNPYADIGFDNSVDLSVENRTTDGEIALRVGARNALITDDQGVQVAGSVVASTPAAASDPLATMVDLFDQQGAERLAFVGFDSTSRLELTNRVREAQLALVVRNASAASRDGVVIDPAGGVSLGYPETGVAATLSTTRFGTLTQADDGQPLLVDAFAGAAQSGKSVIRTDGGGLAIAVQSGGNVNLERTNGAGDSIDTYIGMKENGPVELYYDGFKRAETNAGSLDIIADDSLSTTNRRLNIRHANSTLNGRFGYSGSDTLIIENRLHGEKLELWARATGGTARPHIVIDPTGSDANETPTVAFYVGANIRANVRGYEDDDFGTSLSHFNGQGVEKPTGFNVMPTIEQPTNDTITTLDRVGSIFFNTASFAPTYTVAQDTTTPIGATWAIANESNNDITLLAGTGVAIKWFDASTGTVDSRASGGSFALAQAATATLYKRNDTEYWLWGAGIS